MDVFCFGEALQCYECGSLTSTDAKCEDTFKRTGVSKNSCSGSCAKYKGEKDGLQCEYQNKDVCHLFLRFYENERNKIIIITLYKLCMKLTAFTLSK